MQLALLYTMLSYNMGTIMSAAYLVRSIHFLHRPILNIPTNLRALALIMIYFSRIQVLFTGIHKLALLYANTEIGTMSAAYLVRSIHFQHRPMLKIATNLYELALILQ